MAQIDFTATGQNGYGQTVTWNYYTNISWSTSTNTTTITLTPRTTWGALTGDNATTNTAGLLAKITNLKVGNYSVPDPTGNGWLLYTAERSATDNFNSGSRYDYNTTATTVLNDTGQASAYNGTYNDQPIRIPISDVFNSSNPTATSAPITCTMLVYGYAREVSSVTGTALPRGTVSQNVTIGTINFRWKPTFNVSSISYDTPYVYANLTTATVTISDLEAQFGGTITDATFTIGEQSASRSTNGTLSIALNASGTFTPKVTVTDSRGQITTQALDDITVNSYVAPTLSFTADRTLATGVPDDEGTYATVDVTLTFSDAVADAVAPSVVVTDENGTQTTPAVTWYTTRASDGTLSGTLSDWSTLSSGDTVYGLIPNLNTQYSYQISIRPRDSEGTGTAITQTLSSAFYTVDFLAGGHGIAFGQPASDVGFECNMPTIFHDTVDVEDTLTATDITASGNVGADNFLLDLSDYQTTGSVDKELYDAIVALGWDSDVLVN